MYNYIIYYICVLLSSPASISPKQTVSGFLSGLESSGWLKHIHLILEAAIFTAKVSQHNGTTHDA